MLSPSTRLYIEVLSAINTQPSRVGFVSGISQTAVSHDTTGVSSYNFSVDCCTGWRKKRGHISLQISWNSMTEQRDEIFKQKVNDCVRHIILQKFTNLHAIQNICNEIGWPRFLRHPVYLLLAPKVTAATVEFAAWCTTKTLVTRDSWTTLMRTSLDCREETGDQLAFHGQTWY